MRDERARVVIQQCNRAGRGKEKISEAQEEK